MVKFLSTGPDGRRMLGLGLVAGNIERLQAGKPIHFDKEHLDVASICVDDIVIFYGHTEEAIEQELRGT